VGLSTSQALDYLEHTPFVKGLEFYIYLRPAIHYQIDLTRTSDEHTHTLSGLPDEDPHYQVKLTPSGRPDT
jgi:hypothetical protein